MVALRTLNARRMAQRPQPGRNTSALAGVLPPYSADLLLPNLEHLLQEEHSSQVLRLSLKQPVRVLPRVSGHLTDDVDNLDLTKVASDFLFDSISDSGTLLTAEAQKIGHELADMAEWLRPKNSLSGQARHNENWESRYEEMRRDKEGAASLR